MYGDTSDGKHSWHVYDILYSLAYKVLAIEYCGRDNKNLPYKLGSLGKKSSGMLVDGQFKSKFRNTPALYTMHHAVR